MAVKGQPDQEWHTANLDVAQIKPICVYHKNKLQKVQGQSYVPKPLMHNI